MVGERAAVGVEAHARERARRVETRRACRSLDWQQDESRSRRCRAAARRSRRRALRCSESMPRLSGIRYDAGSWLTTTRSQATPPHDQRRSAWASERSRPRPCATPAETRTIGRSPEMPKRQSRRRSQTLGDRFGARRSGVRERAHEQQRGRQRLDRGEVLGADAHLAQADAGRASPTSARRARRGSAGGTCRSPRAASPRRRRPARAERQTRAWRWARSAGAPANARDRVEAGVERRAVAASGATGGSSKAASGWLALAVAAEPALAIDLDARSATFAGSASARKCAAMQRPCSVGQARLALEDERLVAAPATRRCTNRFGNAGCASSARGSASVTSNADSSSSVERPLAAGCAARPGGTRCRPRGLTQTVRRRLELGPGRVEADAVGVEAAVIVRRRVGRRDAGSARPARGWRSQRRWKKLP